jgi:hypothetical protein
MWLSKTTKKYFTKMFNSTNPFYPNPYKLQISQFCPVSLKKLMNLDNEKGQDFFLWIMASLMV